MSFEKSSRAQPFAKFNMACWWGLENQCRFGERKKEQKILSIHGESKRRDKPYRGSICKHTIENAHLRSYTAA